MSADDNILKSFLYQIGAKLDEPSIRKASDQLDKLSKNILSIGAGIEGLALTLAAVTVKMADSFEKMYWSSQRTGASVRNMKAFEYGVSQLGGTVEGAHSAIENFAAFMRRTPGGQSFIKNTFGVQTTGDAAKDLQSIAGSLGKMYRTGGAQQAKALNLASFIGIGDEDTLRAIINPSFIGFLGRYNDEVAKSGVNMQNAAKNSTAFMQQVRDLGVQFDLLKIKVFSDLEGKFGGKLVQLSQYLENHLPDIAAGIERVIDKIIYLEDRVEALVRAMGGWKTVSEEILALWLGGKALGAIANVMKFFGAFAGASTVAGGAAATTAGVGGAGVGAASLVAGGGALAVAGGLAYGLSKYGGGRPGASDHPGMKFQPTGRGGYWVPDNSKTSIVDYFVSQGWSRAQATGIAARLLREDSDLDPSKQGDLGRGGYQAYGIGQWHRDRQENFKKWSGHDIRGSSLAEQLAFVNYELTQGAERAAGNKLRDTFNARSAGRVVAQFWSRPQDLLGEASRTGQDAQRMFDGTALGAGSSSATHITINNDTDINVHGSDDPSATGAAVASQQGRAYADQLRNTKGAIQ